MEIRILPGNIANVIAAGEVVQRPASVVKELMENAVDAGADRIDVIITDAGRTLIQVIDNGCGMTPDDAVLCFERHATSKLASAEDLMNILTYGFRGEALASIAAVAEVKLKTKRRGNEVGCEVMFADSKHVSTEEVSVPAGTNISVRNLFYNVPARRKYLKSDNVEFRHIVSEFTRIALAAPGIGLSLTHNGKDVFVLKPAKSLKFRVQDVLGASVANEFVDLAAETSVVGISGFIGRPDMARKSSGNQYFFVNGRFFRSPYLHKAVMKAYENLVTEGAVPSYVLYLELDPHTVDVNVSPTKTEIKFQDDNVIFQIIYAAVKEALGRNSFGASIDFDVEGAPDIPVLSRNYEEFRQISEPGINVDAGYNPFENDGFPSENSPFVNTVRITPEKRSCPSFTEYPSFVDRREDYGKLFEDKILPSKTVLVMHGKYIFTAVRSGIMVVNIRRAHERILYDEFLEAILKNRHTTQTALFPVSVQVGVENRILIEEHAQLLESLGFDIRAFGNDAVVVNGVPEGFSAESGKIQEMIPDLIFALSDDHTALGGAMASAMAERFARLGALNAAEVKSPAEAQKLIDRLFACENAEYTSAGKKIAVILSPEEIEKKFN